MNTSTEATIIQEVAQEVAQEETLISEMELDLATSTTTEPGMIEVPIESIIPEEAKTTAKAKIAKTTEPKTPSKADNVFDMVKANFAGIADGTAVARAEMIRRIMAEQDMKNAGASTYYQNAVTRMKKEGLDTPELPRAVASK